MPRDVTALRALAEIILSAEWERETYPEDEVAFAALLVDKGLSPPVATSLSKDYGLFDLRCRTSDTCYYLVTRPTGDLRLMIVPIEDVRGKLPPDDPVVE